MDLHKKVRQFVNVKPMSISLLFKLIVKASMSLLHQIRTSPDVYLIILLVQASFHPYMSPLPGERYLFDLQSL